MNALVPFKPIFMLGLPVALPHPIRLLASLAVLISFMQPYRLTSAFWVHLTLSSAFDSWYEYTHKCDHAQMEKIRRQPALRKVLPGVRHTLKRQVSVYSFSKMSSRCFCLSFLYVHCRMLIFIRLGARRQASALRGKITYCEGVAKQGEVVPRSD